MRNFSRVGDLWVYLNRFSAPVGTEVYQELTRAGVETFESCPAEFNAKFGRWQNDQTKLADFVIGKSYSSWDLGIFTHVYDVRSGGILVIGKASHSATGINRLRPTRTDRNSPLPISL